MDINKRNNLLKIYCIHGAWLGPWVWDKYMEFFSLFYSNIFTIELGNRNAPDWNQRCGDFNFFDYVDTVYQTIFVENMAKNHKIVLLGHSMGGLISLKTAEILKVDAVILIDPTFPANISYLKSNRIEKKSIPGNEIIPPSFSPGDLLGCNDDVKALIKEKSVVESRAVMNDYCFKRGGKGINIDADKINTPILLCNSDTQKNDSLLGQKYAKFLKADFKNYKNIGHLEMLFGKKGKIIQEDIIKWLKEKL